MNICFVANFSKTYLFDALAKELAKDKSVNIFWIVVNKPLSLFLEDEYGKKSVLYINRKNINKSADAVGDFSINELLYGDRVLRYEMENGRAFLTNIQKPVHDFLVDNEISFIFGEQTWAHELLIARLAKSIGIKYSEPQVVRIPNNRFAFFEGELKQRLIEVANPATDFDKEVFKVEKPDYLIINDAIVKRERSISGRLKKVERFFKKVKDHEDDPSISNASLRAKLRFKEELNKERYHHVKRVSFDSIKNEKYVLHTLHKQPENSIDVYGRYYEDQTLNIINLWRKLPLGWKLVVKEHTNAIGDRELKFYNSLLKFPGICFVEEKTNSYDLIQHAQLIVTITGTIAYEAALMQVPCVTFSDIYFTEMNYCSFKTLTDLSNCDSLADWVKEIKETIDNRAEFCQYIMRNSFPGNFSDPLTDPSVLDSKNVSILAQGFKKILNISL